MRIITTKIHGILDYLFGILLIISPWAFNFSHNITAQWVAIFCGAGIIIYSIITRYEYSHWKLASLSVHLWFDGLLGVILISAPWFFGFHHEVTTPFVLMGVAAIIVPLLTHTHASIEYPGATGDDYIHAL